MSVLWWYMYLCMRYCRKSGGLVKFVKRDKLSLFFNSYMRLTQNNDGFIMCIRVPRLETKYKVVAVKPSRLSSTEPSCVPNYLLVSIYWPLFMIYLSGIYTSTNSLLTITVCLVMWIVLCCQMPLSSYCTPSTHYAEAYLYYYTHEDGYTASNVPRDGQGAVIPHPDT